MEVTAMVLMGGLDACGDFGEDGVVKAGDDTIVGEIDDARLAGGVRPDPSFSFSFLFFLSAYSSSIRIISRR